MMSERRLRWGKSKRSMLVFAGRDAHLFIWCPWLGADSAGATFRYRVGDDWVHYRLLLGQRGRSRDRNKMRGGRFTARRTLILCEVSRWRTRGGTQERTDLKAYVRLKLSPGGREI